MDAKKPNTMTFYEDADKIARILIGNTDKSVRTCNLAANAIVRAIYILANNAVASGGEGPQLVAKLEDLYDANESVVDALDYAGNPLLRANSPVI